MQASTLTISTPISAFSDSSEVSESTLFLKYKEGKALPNAPFKLVELLPMSTSIDEDSSSAENKHKVRGPYRKYTCQEKQEAVENLLRWKKFGCERKEGGGRPTDQEMERIVHLKIKQGELTDEKQIRDLAISLSKIGSFKASKGWFVKFCQRFDIKFPGSPSGQLAQGDPESTDSQLA